MNLLLLSPAEIGDDGLARIDGDRARHVRKVLHKSVGDTVRVGVIDGPLGLARIEAMGESALQLSLDLRAAPPPRPRVDLVLAMPRPKVLKRLFAPLAALGVHRLYLTNAEKVERCYFDSHATTEDVYRPRLLEGLSQAQDTLVPEVRVIRRLKPFVEDELADVVADKRGLLADPVYSRSAHAVATRVPSHGRAVLALGPEGGWTTFERDLLERTGFVGVGLGPRTQRTDVATIALMTLVHDGLA